MTSIDHWVLAGRRYSWFVLSGDDFKATVLMPVCSAECRVLPTIARA